MGYILLSPKYIKSKSEENKEENKIENWHLFETKTLEKEYKRDCITIKDDNIKISKNPQCKNEILSDITDLEKKDINSFTIGYRLGGIRGQYLNEFIKDYIKEHDEYGIEKYDFLGAGIYYTDKNRTFFYSDDADIIRIIACMLRRCVCGNCMRILYSNLDNEDGD